MVCFKITCGGVTRKFSVKPGEISYDQLQERIASLFPALKTKDLHLKYRDADGDVITISTDQEFQEALSELPIDHVWKLHIHNSGAATNPAPRRSSGVPSDFFFHHHPSSFGGLLSNPWSGFGHRFSHPWLSSNPWEPFDKMLQEHTQELNTVHNAMESTSQPAGSAAEKSSEAAVAKQHEGTVSSGMQIKNFGSWEPKEFEGPFGKGRIIGPVGYYMSWGSGPEDEAMEDGSEQPKEQKEGPEKMESDTQ